MVSAISRGSAVMTAARRATAIARAPFLDVVDLVNCVETKARSGRKGLITDSLSRMHFIVLDESGYPPIA